MKMEHGTAYAVTIGGARLELLQGDITRQEDVEAIGNAANTRLAGGGGVDGAIHRAAGPALMEELKAKHPGGCPTGGAVITAGGRLKALYVIHAVGPVYSGSPRDAERLAGAYRESLALCSRHRIQSVAFPSISTGAYGYPVEEAARVALEAVRGYVDAQQDMRVVRFVLYDERTLSAYARVLSTVMGSPAGRGGGDAR